MILDCVKVEVNLTPGGINKENENTLEQEAHYTNDLTKRRSLDWTQAQAGIEKDGMKRHKKMVVNKGLEHFISLLPLSSANIVIPDFYSPGM